MPDADSYALTEDERGYRRTRTFVIVMSVALWLLVATISVTALIMTSSMMIWAAILYLAVVMVIAGTIQVGILAVMALLDCADWLRIQTRRRAYADHVAQLEAMRRQHERQG